MDSKTKARKSKRMSKLRLHNALRRLLVGLGMTNIGNSIPREPRNAASEQTAQSELVDVVVVGEGEITFPSLIQAIEKKQPFDNFRGLAFVNGQNVTLTHPRPFIDLDTLLPVPWELINVEDYINEDNYFLKNSPRILDMINKGFHFEDIVKANERCRKHGIVPAYSFIVGFPTETFDEINATIDLACPLGMRSLRARR